MTTRSVSQQKISTLTPGSKNIISDENLVGSPSVTPDNKIYQYVEKIWSSLSRIIHEVSTSIMWKRLLFPDFGFEVQPAKLFERKEVRDMKCFLTSQFLSYNYSAK